MKSIMKKTICAVLLISAAVLACSRNIFNGDLADNRIRPVFDKDGYWKTPDFRVKLTPDGKISYYGSNSLYGAYLAGRVAHLRYDLDNAAEYYKIVLDKDTKNPEITRYIYVILTSLGNLNDAAAYAQKEIDNSKEVSLAPMIVAIKDFNDADYAKVRQDIEPLNNQDAYRTIINPMIEAWSYAGEKNEQKAIAAFDKMDKANQMTTLALFHKGMIYDYLGNKQKAAECFSKIIKEQPQEVTFRVLDIITNFYVRSGDRTMAQQISGRYNDNSTLSILLTEINRKIDAANTQSPAIIDTPQKGLAEALFNIGTLFRISNHNPEFAQLYIASASFLNPDYDIAKIALANILEENGLYKEANRLYAQIQKNSGSYFIAQLKIIENLNTLKDYGAAEKLLRTLLKDYPNNTQLLSNLADIERELNKPDEAIKLYQQALETQKHPDGNSWLIYYTLGASYQKIKKFDKTEECLTKALELSNRNPNVLNYLGYFYLINDKNIDEAVQMIIDANKQYAYDDHIFDSLGWVFFRLGQYDKAVFYLEQASDMNPANAVISDHLGDAYWFIGRKNEAVFQWQHALALKEDAEEIDRQAVQKKIDEGRVENKILTLHNPEVIKELNALNVGDDKTAAK